MRLPYTSTAAAVAATLSVLLPVTAGQNLYDYGIECKAHWPSETGNYRGPPVGYTGPLPSTFAVVESRDLGASINRNSVFDCSRFGDEKGREKCEAYFEAWHNTTALVKKNPQIPTIDKGPGQCCMFTFECAVFTRLVELPFLGDDGDKALCCIEKWATTCEDVPVDLGTEMCYPPLCSNADNSCGDDVPVEVWHELGLTWGEPEEQVPSCGK